MIIQKLKELNKLLFVIAMVALTIQVRAFQEDSIKANTHLKKKLILGGVAYASSMVLLNEAWYKNSPRQSFHFFNDNAEWYQVDKMGHSFTSFHLTRSGSTMFSQAGYSKGRSLIYGSLISFVIMTPIEWLDGYSTAYGASLGDIGANILGSSIYVGSKLLSDKKYFTLKYSFYRTDYAPLRPDVLGESWKSEWLKDYNGQTYWVSINMDQLIPVFPKWINLAFGTGVTGLVHARPDVNLQQGYNSYREFYVAFDPDLSDIRTSKKWIAVLINTLDMFHFPAPALEISKNGIKGRFFR
ncbi:MAG: YfiM family protein [Cyclobacteriaceae bacterium]|nr:YfiM family protein [Cyclobacteriaceae bacterium]